MIPDAGGVRRFLARERFHLALHGHQHVDWHEVREIDGWFLAISAAASAGVSAYGRREWSLPIAYQILVAETDSGCPRALGFLCSTTLSGIVVLRGRLTAQDGRPEALDLRQTERGPGDQENEAHLELERQSD